MNLIDSSGRVRSVVVDLCGGDSQCLGVLQQAPEIALIGSSSVCQVGKLLALNGPAVVILDADCPSALSPELLVDIVENSPSFVLVCLPQLENDFAVSALRLGVRGFLSHRVGAAELVHALKCVANGEIWASREQLYLAFAEPALRQVGHGRKLPVESGDLTPREQDVVSRICSGLSNKEIARDLNISPKTVKTHLQRIYKKNQVHSRLQLAMGI